MRKDKAFWYRLLEVFAKLFRSENSKEKTEDIKSKEEKPPNMYPFF